ncbi:thymidine phosphorylase [Limnoglobus roseus]|uniref:thymidine phosphorylase n=1 Tax=Limnoglobus roseus TaxID=2598579 RepID=A0A5C1AGW0_9BACT|nr:thymidine phosphorylase [Limnoglobus roseus]QEL17875.1 thymidine phosphorylase [Limnoglobus roseus]
MRPVDVISRKRDGHELTAEEIRSFVTAAASGSGWQDAQLSALLMAIYLKGMSAEETVVLTREMTDSGKRLDLSDIPGPKVDKHSTGGVGDKTSLILAPLVAACGVNVPMMSGRGLGHTGGTLDKLEAIPGFRVNLSEAEFRTAVRAVRIGMIGQTRDVAPADKTLYAMRDVTGTVECIPLITASILSKKLAEGIEGLVMDVKCGRGAFMKTREKARALANTIVKVAKLNGLRCEAVITAMDAPLGRAVGNSLEVIESIEALKGNGPADLTELSVNLAARMVQLSGVVKTLAEAERKVTNALTSGQGVEAFRQMVAQQGGDARVVDDYTRLPTAPKTHDVTATSAGVIVSLDAEAIGLASMKLGGGRARSEDTIDPAVGVIVRAKPGEEVRVGDAVFTVHYRDESRFHPILPQLHSAYTLTTGSPSELPLILEEVT